MIFYGALAALGGAAIYANLPTRWTIGAVVPTAAYLSKAFLVPVHDEHNVKQEDGVEASKLFAQGPTLVMAVRRPGCPFCRKEAKELSTLKPDLDSAGIRLMAVVHETLGVNEFKPFFDGDVYYDKDKHFYGPNQRWLPHWMGALRLGTYINGYNTHRAGVKGNLAVGEGRLLGGVYLIANEKLVWHHLEKEWGDAANIDEVREAIRKFK